MEKAIFQQRTTKGLNSKDEKYPLCYEEKDNPEVEERHHKKDSKHRHHGHHAINRS